MSQLLHAGIRAVYFDAVGTLLFPDPGALTIYAETARRYGLDLSPDEVRTRFIAAYRLEEDADRAAGWVTSEDREQVRWHRIVTASLAGVPDPDACFRHLFDHFSRPQSWRLNPDAEHVIAALRDRGLVLGLGTNYDARIWPVLAGFPALDPLRGRVLVSAAVGHRKPGAGFFREVVRSAGCSAEEVLFVGDDLGNDYEGALAAGLAAVLYDPDGRYPAVPHRITRLGELLTSGSRAGPP
jgi:putative hydrolase of the HAD superfamily